MPGRGQGMTGITDAAGMAIAPALRAVERGKPFPSAICRSPRNGKAFELSRRLSDTQHPLPLRSRAGAKVTDANGAAGSAEHVPDAATVMSAPEPTEVSTRPLVGVPMPVSSGA